MTTLMLHYLEAGEGGGLGGEHEADLVEGVAQRVQDGAQLRQALSHKQLEGPELGADSQHLSSSLSNFHHYVIIVITSPRRSLPV